LQKKVDGERASHNYYTTRGAIIEYYILYNIKLIAHSGTVAKVGRS